MIVTRFDRVTDVAVDAAEDLDWPAFAALLCTHHPRDGKDGPGYSPATYRAGGVRENDNAIEISALVLDVDKITEDEAATALQRLQSLGLRFVWHTTHSHAPPEKAALRVAVALSRPVPAAQWGAFYRAAAAYLGITHEPKCSNPARFWYLPSCTPGTEPEAQAVEGAPLDVDTVPVLAESPEKLVISPESSGDRPPASPVLLAEVMARLAELGPAVQGAGGDAHTYRACATARHGFALSESEALTVLSLWDQSNVPPWGPAALLTKIRNAGRYAQGSYGEARDVFESRGLFPGTTAPAGTGGYGPLTLLAVPEAPPPSEFYALPVCEFLGHDDPDDSSDDWIVRGVLAAGVPQVIGGPPKSHKTFLAEHLFLTVAAGLPCWLEQGDLKVSPMNVLLLLREDSERESRRRIWRLARGLGFDPRSLEGKIFIDCVTPFYFSSDADMLRLGRTIKERKIGLVGIDSLSRTHTGDENSVKEMNIVTNRWNQICQGTGAAVGMIHHFNKWGEGPLLQRLRGSSDIGAMVRHIMGVTKNEQGGSLIEFDGNLHPILDPFMVKITDVEVEGKKAIRITHDGDAKSNAVAEMDQKILEALAKAQPRGLSKGEIQSKDYITGTGAFKIARRDALLGQGKIRLLDDRYHLAVALTPE